MEFLIITGLSGAGKSRAASFLEDMGFYCVDNIPPEFLMRLAQLCMSGGRYSRMAVVTDVRSGTSFDLLFSVLKELKDNGGSYRILYVEASVQSIINRYKETRRLHPLTRSGEELGDTIKREIKMLTDLRGSADYIIDTTNLSTGALRDRLVQLFGMPEGKNIMVSIMSFGYKYGIPLDADIVFDVRFLPNPYYLRELRPYDGRDERVREYIFSSPRTEELLDRLSGLLSFTLPCYYEEGKAKLVIAVGCTGGRHRSVFVAEELTKHIESLGFSVECIHRDADKV